MNIYAESTLLMQQNEWIVHIGLKRILSGSDFKMCLCKLNAHTYLDAC